MSELRNLMGQSTFEKVEFLKNIEEEASVLVKTPNGDVLFVSHIHLEEMEEIISVKKQGGSTFLVAPWRRAGKTSKYLRCDEPKKLERKAPADYL